MGANGLVDHEHVHHRSLHHHHHQHNSCRKPFLPMLCSSRPSSIKQLRLPRWEDDRSASFSDDPLSPKISCMGQVKRNNRVVGFPTPTKLFTINVPTTKANNTDTNTTNFKYSKLKRLFSAKALLVYSTTAAAAASPATTTTSGSCGRATRRKKTGNGCPRGSKKSCEKIENSVLVSLADMDPPLPVPKKVRKPEEGGSNGGESLWKRRSGGVALKGLELQQIHHNHQSHHFQPDTV